MFYKCGDGYKIANVEECDDGNIANGDGCDQFCRVEKATDCSLGEFVQSGICKVWSTCDPGEYVSQTPTSSNNRGCAACPTDSFSTTINADLCTNYKTCPPGTAIFVAGTPVSDRQCEPCSSGIVLAVHVSQFAIPCKLTANLLTRP